MAEYLSEDGSFMCISVGDLLNKEISKKSDYGKQIIEQRKSYAYIKDEIVMDLVQKQIDQCEKEQKSWIIEGFPRTKTQALALNRWGIIPDKFIMLEIGQNVSLEKVRQNLRSEEGAVHFPEEQTETLARAAL